MKRVLVVDDDRSILQVAKVILERSGFTTVSADNGPEALRLLQTHNVDVLLTDMVMPAVSGTELILEARKRHPNLAICCMTAYIPLIDVALERVFIISKPFSPRELINAVGHVLEERLPRRDQMSASSSASLSVPESQIHELHTPAT